MRILIIEDEKLLAESLSFLLRSRGYEAEAVYNGSIGLEYAQSGEYDLLIVDVMMPGLDGYELTRCLRSGHIGTPILMLTAKSEIENRIEGLKAGADYYLAKPFDNRELLACVGTLLRRYGSEVNELCYGNVRLNLATCVLACGEATIRLSAREFDVMRLLLQAKDRILSKDTILTHVWGLETDATENYVEVYVGFLRKKLKSIGANIRIEALRRLGYHLEVDGP